MNILKKLLIVSLLTNYSINAVWFANETSCPAVIFDNDNEIFTVEANSCKNVTLKETLILKPLQVKKIINGIILSGTIRTILLPNVSSDTIILFNFYWEDCSPHDKIPFSPIKYYPASELNIQEKEEITLDLILQKINIIKEKRNKADREKYDAQMICCCTKGSPCGKCLDSFDNCCTSFCRCNII